MAIEWTTEEQGPGAGATWYGRTTLGRLYIIEDWKVVAGEEDPGCRFAFGMDQANEDPDATGTQTVEDAYWDHVEAFATLEEAKVAAEKFDRETYGEGQ